MGQCKAEIKNTIIRTVLPPLIFCFILLPVACDISPKLTTKQMEWKTHHRNVDTDDPNYPLQIIADGYKMIRVYRIQAKVFREIKQPPEDKVEWGWRMAVKNKSDKAVKVSVTYRLADKDDFTITSNSNYSSEYIKPGEIKTIRETSTMDYEQVDRVAGSHPLISYFYASE
ncbi:MAG: hypothetical protein ABIK26_07750 [Candidatus Omnitrophota bacterium]